MLNRAIRVLMLSFLMLGVLAMGFAGGAAEEIAEDGDEYRFTMVIYGTQGNPFWAKVVAGANETADMLGVDVDIQYADNEADNQINILETAITNQVDGIGIIINYNDAYDAVVERAMEEGIPVIAYNIDDTQGREGNARMAFIGQDFGVAGYLITRRLIEESGIGRGDHVVAPVEHPGAVYAQQRYEGVKRALDEVGATSEVLDTGGVSLEDTLDRLTQYLLGRPDTDAVLAMGGMPMEMAPQAISDAGLDIPNAGFDITKRIVENVLAGRSIATVDQQPYLQGSYTVTQLYLYNTYGLLPVDINTGGAIIDESNAEIVLELADTVR